VAIDIKSIDDDAVRELLEVEETHFVDLKRKHLSPAKLSKIFSALANASGGEVFLGIEEFEGMEGKERQWDGFADVEEANDFFSVLQNIDPLSSNHTAEFVRNDNQHGAILHLTIFKSQSIITSTDGKAYIRRSASSLPVSEGDALERLKFEKEIKSFEDERTNADIDDVTNSEVIISFLLDVVPTGEPEDWVRKQRLAVDDNPTVAGVLLYSDSPQSTLPKRSAVKLLRYQTKQEAERDFLAFDPITIEGPIYDLIYSSVDKVKEIIEGIEKAGPTGMEKVIYPPEALQK
jgi:ATP-dependent DNA helicase RecG